MSEYEKINAGVKTQMAARRKQAVKRIILVAVLLLVALAAIAGLEAIGFISWTFAIILASVSVCISAFKLGWICRDIKF